MAPFDTVKRVPRKRRERVVSSILRGGGASGVLSGVLFVAWGYLDRPNIAESLRTVTCVLSLAVPALFLAAVMGVSALLASRLGVLGWIGLALAAYALCWRVIKAILGGTAVWVYFARGSWPHYLTDWLMFLLLSLTFIGIAAVSKKPARGVGALALATGTSGWIYYLTDSGGALEARSVHVGFGLLFSLGWMALVVGLLVADTKRAQRLSRRG